MEKPTIQVNQNIKVALHDDEAEWYVANIQDITGYDFCISIPTKASRPLVLSNGDLLKVSFIKGPSRYEFETKVTGWRYDNIPLYALALPKEYKRVQLREFVRIPLILDVAYAEVPEAGKQPEFFESNSVDLSGGGMRLLLDKEYPAGTRLILKFTLALKTGDRDLEVVGKVVRTWPDERLKCHHTAIQFVEINRGKQDIIARYVFMKLSERRRLS